MLGTGLLLAAGGSGGGGRSDDAKKAADLLEQGLQAQVSGDTAPATSLYDKIIKLDPSLASRIPPNVKPTGT